MVPSSPPLDGPSFYSVLVFFGAKGIRDTGLRAAPPFV